MKVKIENKYLIDTSNKNDILLLAENYAAKGFWFYLSDAESGGYDRKGNEYILNTTLYKKSWMSCPYATIQTQYGRYTETDLTVYVLAAKIYNFFVKLEKDIEEHGALRDSGETGENLVHVEQHFVSASTNYADEGEKCLVALGVFDPSYSKDKLHYIYTDCLHDFCKSGKFDVSAAKSKLIDKEGLKASIDKYNYMKDVYPDLCASEIQKAKNYFESL